MSIYDPIHDKKTIDYKDVINLISEGDEVVIRLYGEVLRLLVISKDDLYARLFNGLWGISLTEAYQTIKYDDFKIIEVNGIEVLQPNQDKK